jgi:hypothetical protein
MHYVRTEFAHLVQDSWAYWRPDLETFTEKIRITMEEKSGGGIVYPPGGLAVFGFIDDTSVRTTRVGGGPAAPGPDAPRFNTLVQMGFYSGYKKIHGVKYQTVELPNGMCMDSYGPVSILHSDPELVTLSNLEEKLTALSEDTVKQYVIYGDGIFAHTPHLKSKHIGETTREERYENGIMFKIRVPNEWAYGITENLFSSLKWYPGLRIKQNHEHAYYYMTGLLLRNAHCCINGNQTSQYFDCRPPTLEEYFGRRVADYLPGAQAHDYL